MSDHPPYRVEISRAAQKSMARLPRDLRQRLTQAIFRLGENPRPRGYAQLKGHEGLYFRVRVGDWRIIYTIDDHVLVVTVVQVGPRGDVYTNL